MTHQGWRFFSCQHCGARWRETCRDYSTESNSRCVNNHCESHLRSGVSPFDAWADASVEIDAYHNLVKETQIERFI